MQWKNRNLRRTRTSTGYTNTRVPKKGDLNDDECGVTPYVDDDRIVGGEEAEQFEYPWNVALTLRWGLQFCGGSLINEKVMHKFYDCYVNPLLYKYFVSEILCTYLVTPSDYFVLDSTY